LIPPSQVQQDDFNLQDNSSPHKQVSQEQDDIAMGTQVSHKQPTEQSTPSSEPQPNLSQYGCMQAYKTNARKFRTMKHRISSIL
jgi:hypothetical protein